MYLETEKSNFQKLKKFVDELNSSNSRLHKLEVLRKYKHDDFIRRVLFYTYNQYYQFFVTSKNLKKLGLSVGYTTTSYEFFNLLDLLRTRSLTGHAAICAVNSYCEQFDESIKELIYRVIDKDLKCRISVDSVNDIYDNYIPTFSVALGFPYEDVMPKFGESYDWYASRKLDGIRVVTIIRTLKDGDDYIKFYSREGNEFTQFDKVKEQLISLGIENYVLDGEMCIMNGDAEDFKAVAGEVKRNNHTIQNPRYLLFDALTLDEFESGTSSRKFIDRIKDLEGSVINGLPYIMILKQERVIDLPHYTALYAVAVHNGYEGLVLRYNTVYEGKRSKNVVKCKPFNDAEYVVKSIGTGPFRVIDKITGLEREEEMLTQVYIEHKGNTVAVGSGFSIDERRFFFANPNQIIGKTITVQYFEESEDAHGNPSLRMPTIKFIHGISRKF